MTEGTKEKEVKGIQLVASSTVGGISVGSVVSPSETLLLYFACFICSGKN